MKHHLQTVRKDKRKIVWASCEVSQSCIMTNPNLLIKIESEFDFRPLTISISINKLKIYFAHPEDCKSTNVIIKLTWVKLDIWLKISLLLQSVEYAVYPGRCCTLSVVGHYQFQQQVPIWNETFLNLNKGLSRIMLNYLNF